MYSSRTLASAPSAYTCTGTARSVVDAPTGYLVVGNSDGGGDGGGDNCDGGGGGGGGSGDGDAHIVRLRRAKESK